MSFRRVRDEGCPSEKERDKEHLSRIVRDEGCLSGRVTYEGCLS